MGHTNGILDETFFSINVCSLGALSRLLKSPEQSTQDDSFRHASMNSTFKFVVFTVAISISVQLKTMEVSC
jgi:hypothetical protein